MTATNLHSVFVQQQAGPVPPSKTTVSVSAADGWQLEGMRHIIGHGGSGVIARCGSLDTDTLRESDHFRPQPLQDFYGAQSGLRTPSIEVQRQS